eukprot:1157433-Pelagomonas_calceolata.AAC.16
MDQAAGETCFIEAFLLLLPFELADLGFALYLSVYFCAKRDDKQDPSGHFTLMKCLCVWKGSEASK